MASAAEIERHRARSDDRASWSCSHLVSAGPRVAWYWLPYDPATKVAAGFCCRACCSTALNEGATPRPADAPTAVLQ